MKVAESYLKRRVFCPSLTFTENYCFHDKVKHLNKFWLSSKHTGLNIQYIIPVENCMISISHFICHMNLYMLSYKSI